MHTGTPGMYPHQATTLWQLDVLVDQGVNPTPAVAQLIARRMHGGEETESNHALSAMEEASNSRLNMWVSNMHESSFWEIGDTVYYFIF